MSNNDLVLGWLRSKQPGKYCDDCISDELGIRPRQQVNQICHRLEDQEKIRRENGTCASCGNNKLVNATISEGISPSLAEDGDIEKTRTFIVGICREIWKKHHPDRPPLGIAALINQLRNEELVPAHQANMMLTLCGLRNMQVYEGIPLGSRERIIASNAWAIVSDWWEASSTPKEHDK